jgi:hypothetical protein
LRSLVRRIHRRVTCTVSERQAPAEMESGALIEVVAERTHLIANKLIALEGRGAGGEGGASFFAGT